MTKDSNNIRILGIDPSLVRTAYAFGYSVKLKEYGTLIASNQHHKLRGSQRLKVMRMALEHLIDETAPDLCVYEDYSFGSKGRATYGIAELGGLFRLTLYEAGIDTLYVPPTTLKLLTAGIGNADKDQMIAAVKETHEIKESIKDDEADAIGLWHIGRGYAGYTRMRTSSRRTAMGKCILVKGVPLDRGVR